MIIKKVETFEKDGGITIIHEWTTIDDWYMVPESKFLYHFHGQIATYTIGSEPNTPGHGTDSSCMKCGSKPSEEVINLLYFFSSEVEAVHQWRLADGKDNRPRMGSNGG